MSSIKLFESEKIRSEWNGLEQKWYFAIIDVIEILTESNNPRRYWSDLKRKLNSEGFSQLYEIIVQLGCIEILNELHCCIQREQIPKDRNDNKIMTNFKSPYSQFQQLK